MEDKIWKLLIDFEGLYIINNYGDIINLKTKKDVLKRIDKNNGYVYVNLTKDKETKKYRLHKLVLRTFKGEKPRHNSVVGHYDNNKTNNFIDNLYWTTTQENTNKAIQDNLMVYPSGVNNQNSIKIKVLDKDNNIVGVYGSLSDTERYITNITKSYISKVCKKENYKLRSHKYKYSICSEKEFMENIDKLNATLIENNKVDKSPTIFLVTNLDTNECIKWDNQTQASKYYNISQANISHFIKNNTIYNNLKFTYIDKTTYKNASMYKNFIDTCENFIILNIFSKEIKEFSTQKELKEYFNLQGHDIRQYKNRNQLIYSEWKIL